MSAVQGRHTWGLRCDRKADREAELGPEAAYRSLPDVMKAALDAPEVR